MGRSKVRNWQAVHAFNRKAGPHKDRKREMLEELAEDEAYEESTEYLRMRPTTDQKDQCPSSAPRSDDSAPLAESPSPQPRP